MTENGKKQGTHITAHGMQRTPKRPLNIQESGAIRTPRKYGEVLKFGKKKIPTTSKNIRKTTGTRKEKNYEKYRN